MGLSTKVQGQVREAAVAELRAANMEDMTERKLRTALEKRLGLELGGSDERQFLRTVINEFLDEEVPSFFVLHSCALLMSLPEYMMQNLLV
jgi:hypothetical protein